MQPPQKRRAGMASSYLDLIHADDMKTAMLLAPLAMMLACPSLLLAQDKEAVSNYLAAKKDAGAKDFDVDDALASKNIYERLFAIELIGQKPEKLTPSVATKLAAAAVDTTAVYSLKCMSCQTDCRTCSGCWGMYGDSDCHIQQEIGAYARQAIEASTKEPAKGWLAQALWPLALRSSENAERVASLMPTLHEAFREPIRTALAGAAAPTGLRLLMSFPQGQCGDNQLTVLLER